jgi:hypothetical protein
LAQSASFGDARSNCSSCSIILSPGNLAIILQVF